MKESVLGPALLAGSLAATGQAGAPQIQPPSGPPLEPEHISLTATLPSLPLPETYQVQLPADNCTVDGGKTPVPFEMLPLLKEDTVTPLGLPAQALQPIASSSASKAQTAEELFSVKESDVKFSVRKLVETLGDSAHEGMVLTAYPDPVTGRPLIGPGVSLDIPPPDPAHLHLQRDPGNTVQFIESASSDLWVASGLAPERLQQILRQYHERVAQYGVNELHRMAVTKELPADITREEADQLARTGVLQAIHNAQGYYPPEKFKELTASQQMALVEMTYQIGEGFEQFATFLNVLNGNQLRTPKSDSKYAHTAHTSTGDRFKDLQHIGAQSKWAKIQSPKRAEKVLAKLDRHYDENPEKAERYVATLIPHISKHARKSRHDVLIAELDKSDKGHAHSVTKARMHHRGHRTQG